MSSKVLRGKIETYHLRDSGFGDGVLNMGYGYCYGEYGSGIGSDLEALCLAKYFEEI